MMGRRGRRPGHGDKAPKYNGPIWIGKAITKPSAPIGPDWIGNSIPDRHRLDQRK